MGILSTVSFSFCLKTFMIAFQFLFMPMPRTRNYTKRIDCWMQARNIFVLVGFQVETFRTFVHGTLERNCNPDWSRPHSLHCLIDC